MDNNWLAKNLSYIDSVTIVDHSGVVTTKQRYNPRFSDSENSFSNAWSLNKNILEVIPSLTIEGSSIMQALVTGKIIVKENQESWNHAGQRTICNNMTFPMISRGRIVGAIEISKDVTHIERDIIKIKKYHAMQSQKQYAGQGQAKYHLDSIISENPEMDTLKKTIAKIADSSSSVLVYGETGTGKELVVQAIHNASRRKNSPFVAVNCAALPQSIFESILFGSTKGAFTGAENKIGLFQAAHQGTLYLDELNSMPFDLQPKLLRAIQEQSVTPIGEANPIKVDVRVVASVNKPLDSLVTNKELREDLYYRLNVINLQIPPLRKRLDDIPILTKHFIEHYNIKLNKDVKDIDEQVAHLFEAYEWKGNVREFAHVIESAMNIVDQEEIITIEHLPAYLHSNQQNFEGSSFNDEFIPLLEEVERLEKRLIKNAMTRAENNISGAAKILRIPRTTLQYKLEKYKIQF